jgi:hypothetical protein
LGRSQTTWRTSRTQRDDSTVATVIGAGLAAFLAVSTLGCGASYQAVYEGEVRFEHCYRLDLESNVPLTQRRECWREWTQFYTYGQSRDRIEFAMKRLREHNERIRSPSGSPAVSDAGSYQPPPAVVAPAPTSPFEAPPSIQARPDAGPEASTPDAKPVPTEDPLEFDPAHAPPGQTCMLLCGKSWHKCADACAPDKKPCKTTCDIRFRSCVARCL